MPLELFYKQIGNSGPPIIILHGLFGSGDNWLTVSKPLAEKHTVYLPDQRNHGRSPQDSDFSYGDMAEDLKAFIEKHSLNDPIIIGHSMGGKVAMQFALTYPALLSKLIVVDIAPRYYPPHHQDVISALLAVPLHAIQNRDEADKAMQPFTPEIGVRQFLLKNLYRNEDNQFAWRMNLPLIIQKIEEIGKANSSSIPFTKPALFINGSNSPYVTTADQQSIRVLFPNVQFSTVAGAGHWVQAEKPVEFVESVLLFLNSR